MTFFFFFPGAQIPGVSWTVWTTPAAPQRETSSDRRCRSLPRPVRGSLAPCAQCHQRAPSHTQTGKHPHVQRERVFTCWSHGWQRRDLIGFYKIPKQTELIILLLRLLPYKVHSFTHISTKTSIRPRALFDFRALCTCPVCSWELTCCKKFC